MKNPLKPRWNLLPTHGSQYPALVVYKREGDEVRLFWASEMTAEMADPGRSRTESHEAADRPLLPHAMEVRGLQQQRGPVGRGVGQPDPAQAARAIEQPAEGEHRGAMVGAAAASAGRRIAAEEADAWPRQLPEGG